MKNLLKSILLLAITILLDACSKKEEITEVFEPTIVGKWEFFKKIEYNESGQELFSDYVNKCIDLKDHLLIEANNTYTEKIMPSNCQSEDNKTSYIYENNELKLRGFSYKLKVISITTNQLKIEFLNNTKERARVDTYLLIRK
ncbi:MULTISPECIES: lipocalin family protein [Flavobacterium]|uniref:Lipocalin-like domain-containing protein n=2 Tax=Flavobacterium TaxID=237 RepID=A0AA94F4R6_9FLAO|nr:MULTISPECIES: lipocalin family protein [Flavobacterium]OXA78724.1 hypothetical protein B0A56_08425 [Flavobacterium columnare NBRC 100251 = ATCC 23463]AMA48369.1 hypothetical protein AWN65_02235 [Flavobacterium covae]AND63470.1 hypothetical protein AX766_03135 [Flavobacterium covae]MCH4830295.1 hypothetical protein [Flavobacterium columnare]MCH4832323.1 hypothetical protein [Flavobacterium columnare]